MQLGLQTAPPKTNRKLRKERKNRAKKVLTVSHLVPARAHCALSLVPRHEEIEGGGASEEGQVGVARSVPYSRFHHPCIALSTTFRKTLCVCILLRMPALSSLMNIMRMRISWHTMFRYAIS